MRGGDFDQEVPTSALTFRFLLSGQYPISRRARLVADVPITHFGIDDDASEDDGTSSTEVGNPYLGAYVQFGDGSPPGEGLAAGGGVRLPMASISEDVGTQAIVDLLALQVGTISEISRVEAFSPDTFTARGYGEYTARYSEGLAGRLRTGLSLLVPTEDTDSRDNVVFF